MDKDPSNMREAGGDYEKPKKVPGVGQSKQSRGSLQKWTGKSGRPLRPSQAFKVVLTESRVISGHQSLLGLR